MSQTPTFMASPGQADWTKDVVEAPGEAGLLAVKSLAEALPRKIKVLVLFGSLRERYVPELARLYDMLLLFYKGPTLDS